jgi:ABC-type dipeptide/oligopeptide/nickel transport system permease component
VIGVCAVALALVAGTLVGMISGYFGGWLDSAFMRGAVLPVVTVIGLQFGLLLAGAAVTETVFAYPGMGKLLVDSIRAGDFPQIQASILILAGTTAS